MNYFSKTLSLFLVLFSSVYGFSESLEQKTIEGPVYISNLFYADKPLRYCVENLIKDKYEMTKEFSLGIPNESQIADKFTRSPIPIEQGYSIDLTKNGLSRLSDYSSLFKSRPVHIYVLTSPKCPGCNNSDRNLYVHSANIFVSYDSTNRWRNLYGKMTNADDTSYIYNWGVRGDNIKVEADILYEPILNEKTSEYGEVKVGKINISSCIEKLKAKPKGDIRTNPRED